MYFEVHLQTPQKNWQVKFKKNSILEPFRKIVFAIYFYFLYFLQLLLITMQSSIKCIIMVLPVMCQLWKLLCRDWHKWSTSVFFFMKTETMQLLMDLFFLAHHLRTTVGLSVIDNGLGPLVWGAEEKIVDYALLAADQKATLPSQVQTSAVVILK